MEQKANISAAEPAVSRGTADDDHDPGRNRGAPDHPKTIGQVAREFGLTLRALRFYESKHLLAPERHGAIRLYHRGDCDRITLILTGRRLGFTLAEIRGLVGRPGTNLHLTREKCVEQITQLEQQKRGIEVAIAELRRIYTSFYKTLRDDSDARSR